MALRPTSSPSPAPSPANAVAEREADQNDAFLREVDDALREDQLKDFLTRYGKPVGAAIAAGLLALAGYLWWSSHQEAAADARGEKLAMALEQVEKGNLKTGDKDLAAVVKDNGGTGTAAAATLMRAGIALEQGRRDEAVTLFATVAADGSAPKPFRDLATIREVATNYDKMKPEVVVERLSPLAQKGNPWFGPAGELLAMAYLDQNKPNLAGPLLADIARDKDAPESLRRRVRQLAGLLGADAVDDPKKVLEETIAPPAGAQPGQPAAAPQP